MVKYKRIFVLGAGFSNSFCESMPTTPQLSRALFSKTSIGREETHGYRELFKLVNSFNRINQNICTIEDLTTMIFSRRIFGSPIEQERYDKIKYQILRFIFNSIESHEVDVSNEETLKDFLIACLVEHDPNSYSSGKNLIITFNYDLLIEKFMDKMLEDINIPNRRPICADYGIELGRYTSNTRITETPPATEPIEILKLHGSFNWFQSKSSNNIDISSVYRVDPLDSNRILFDDDNPVFIPMAHGKELFLHGSLYNFLWVKAFHYLHDAEEIYFIGYGFPKTDINNLYYFSDPILKCKIKRIVVLYSTDRDENLQRLRTLFGRNKIINMDAKQFIQENIQTFNHYYR